MTDDLTRKVYLAETAAVREHLADQTTPLRDRIAAALMDLGHPQWDAAEGADAVLAVLPAPADRDADLAAALAEDLRYVLDYRGPGHAHERPGFWDTSGRPCMHCARLAVARMNLADHDAELRRMAGETATTETQAGAPGRRQTVEYFLQSQQPDGTWESASSFSTDLDFAAARLAARREKMPDLTLRLAERTTTVAVRALPDCLSCRHWSCDGTGECGALLDAWQRCDCTGPAAGARQDGAQR